VKFLFALVMQLHYHAWRSHTYSRVSP
jgi:hypothetical protein